MLGLAALYRFTELASAEPFDRPLLMRVVLALLHAGSDGERRCYDGFWHEPHKPRSDDDDGVARYVRATYMRIQWTGIARTLGLNPDSMTFHAAISKLVDDERAKADPTYAARRAAAQHVREAALGQEIIASKGHPRTPAARDLMAKRIASGESTH